MSGYVRHAALTTLIVLFTAAVQAQSQPVPRPFPGAGSAPAPAQPTAPAPAEPAPPGTDVPAPSAVPQADPAAAAAPVPVMAGPDIGGIPVYPTAVYLDSFDAGQNQTYHLYGTDTAFDLVAGYYRNILRNGGREIFEQPAIRQWDLGRFDDDEMAFPPSVVVKDYTWNGSAGYLHVSGTTEARYATIIQIVPPGPEDR